MSSLVIAPERSVAGKITRSGLVTRRFRPPASTIVASAAAMPRSSTAPAARTPRHNGSGDVSHGARFVGAMDLVPRAAACRHAPVLARPREPGALDALRAAQALVAGLPARLGRH